MVTKAEFDGVTYDSRYDYERLASQLVRVRSMLLAEPYWHTLPELLERVGGSATGISARIRDLRKEKFGGHTVETRRVSGGSWEYRIKNA
jgi:hypothetical protein